MSKLQKATAALHKTCNLWCEQEWEIREMDAIQSTHAAMEIRLTIPNGGITGVSIWDPDRKCGWFLPTEFLPDHTPDWFHDASIHTKLAIEAIDIVRKVLKPWSKQRGKGRKRKPSNVDQLTIFDALGSIALSGVEPIPLRQSDPITIASAALPKQSPPAPSKPTFAIGDIVIATAGRELETHGVTPLTICGFSQLGSPLIKLGDFPPAPIDPAHIRKAAIADMTPQIADPETQINSDNNQIHYKEWRWWESTHQWTYTGAMGLNLTAHHKNSRLFPVNIDPNNL